MRACFVADYAFFVELGLQVIYWKSFGQGSTKKRVFEIIWLRRRGLAIKLHLGLK
jgi:hypothetical protein